MTAAVQASEVIETHDLPVPDASTNLEVERLSRSLVLTASNLDREEAMSIVGLYYSIQKNRISSSHKLSAHQRRVDHLASPALIEALKAQLQKVEQQAARGLKAFAEGNPLGRWAMSNKGCGPIIAAGLLAHIDLNIAQTAGAIWRFAGLDPTIKWEKGCKRPYNATLKRLCWNLGECFKRVSGHEDAFYGQLYKKRKEREIAYNNEGRFREKALERLALALKNKWRISDEQKKTWGEGKIQNAGLDLRAMRYAVKIFLSHYHQVGRTILGLGVPKPWVFEHGKEEHVHMMAPPNWPMTEGS